MLRSGSASRVLGLKSSAQAAVFGLACAALGAVVSSLCWASLELEVTASPRLAERVRPVSSTDAADASQHHEHHTHHCDDCAFCRARAKKMAEHFNAPFVPIHRRADYTVLPPDVLEIDVTGIEEPDSCLRTIHGEHLVHSDGNLDLGSWGKLYVAGKTTAEIKTLIERLLDTSTTDCSVKVAVQTQNSRVFFTIDEDGFGNSDLVQRTPYHGDETVLDAIMSKGPLNAMGRRRIWLARPTPGGGPDAIIPIKWQWTSPTTVVVTNPALLPGDRVFIARQPSWVAFVEHAAKIANTSQAKQASPYDTQETR